MVQDSPGWLGELLHFSSDRSLTILLYALLLLEFVVLPFWSDTSVGKFVVDGFLALILVSGALAVRRFRRAALGTVLIVLLTRTFVHVQPTRITVIVGGSVTLIFFAFACAGILRRVFAAGRITRSRIEGAVAVYLLIGLILGIAYSLSALVDPGISHILERKTSDYHPEFFATWGDGDGPIVYHHGAGFRLHMVSRAERARNVNGRDVDTANRKISTEVYERLQKGENLW